MASIINSIAFKNFFNYYGDYNDTIYELEEGVNIIVADNGAGKSKFFNAFLWLFYDQILDSDDKQKKSIRNSAVKIISDKAKSETSLNDYVEVGIRVEYSTGRHKYRITKEFDATRIGEALTEDESWQITTKDIEVDRTELVLTKYKPIYDEEEKRKIINQLILPNLRQYSFFQGEEVDSIIDFTKSSSIRDAVRTLTNISKYEELHTLLEEVAAKAEKDLNKQNKASKQQNEALDTALASKEELQKKLTDSEKLLKEYQDTYEKAQEEKNKVEKNFANAEKRKELDDLLKIERAKLRSAEDDYAHFMDSINNRFFDGQFAWIGLGFEESVSRFKNKINDYRNKRIEKKTLENVSEDPGKYFKMLPINSPDTVSLQNMIEHEHCYVCDRPAEKGSEAFEYMLKLKNRNADKKETGFQFNNNLSNFFDDVQVNATPFCNRMDSIKESVLQTKRKKEDLVGRVDRLKKKVKELKAKRSDILISGAENEEQDQAQVIISTYKAAIKRLTNAEDRIERYKEDIQKHKRDLKATEREIKSLRPKDIPEGYELNNEMAQDLYEAAGNAKDRVFDNMIKLLEKHANNHFKSLIKYNDLAGGVLKFEKTPAGTINFKYLDQEGNEAAGASTGFQRMKIFSVVMAIISANTSKYNYPLLADAPISEFGDGFIKAFFEETSKIFPQSIILAKELYDGNDDQKLSDLGKTLLKDDSIKKMYVNVIEKGTQQTDLITNKLELK